MIVSTRERWLGRVLLVFLMLITIAPFVSLFVTALHPAGTYPAGLSWPEEPQWGNFAAAFQSAQHGQAAHVEPAHRARRGARSPC